ncbi:DNA-directed DNA polymerase [Tanacetum coccineum]
MTRSTIKKLVEPLKEPEREMHRLRKAVRRQQQNESLAIAWRNLFDGEASSSISYELKITAPTKILREFSSPNSSGFQNPIVYPVEQIGKVLDSQDVWLIQGRAKQWLDRIPPGQISTWEQLVSKFLDNIFPPGHTSTFKDKIIRLLQGNEEPFKDVWIRFQDLIRQASHHGPFIFVMFLGRMEMLRITKVSCGGIRCVKVWVDKGEKKGEQCWSGILAGSGEDEQWFDLQGRCLVDWQF